MTSGVPKKGLFTSIRERRLWTWTALVLLAIWSTLGPARVIAGSLRETGILGLSIILFLVLILCFLGYSWLKRRPDWREAGMVVGVIIAYLMVGVRIDSWEERTHLIEYGIVAALIHEALIERRRNGRVIRNTALMAIIVTAVLGLIDETIQYFIPSRVFDFRDVFFNAFAGFMVIAARLAIGKQKGPGWRLWFLWLLSAAYGWGIAVSVTGLGEISLKAAPERFRDAVVGAVVAGALVCVFQWLLLRNKIKQAHWWFFSYIGAAAFYALTTMSLRSNDADLAWVAGTASFGILLGILQWLVLRRSVRNAGWWVVACAAGWLLGMPAGQEVGWNGLGAVYGAITGIAIVLLLRQEVEKINIDSGRKQ